MFFKNKKRDLAEGFPPFLNNFLSRDFFLEVLPMAKIGREHVDSCRVLTRPKKKTKKLKPLSYV